MRKYIYYHIIVVFFICFQLLLFTNFIWAKRSDKGGPPNNLGNVQVCYHL